jgi:hypothetical protein
MVWRTKSSLYNLRPHVVSKWVISSRSKQLWKPKRLPTSFRSNPFYMFIELFIKIIKIWGLRSQLFYFLHGLDLVFHTGRKRLHTLFH